MDQNYYAHHQPHFPHYPSAHPHQQQQQFIDPFDCQPQGFYIPPPHNTTTTSHSVVCDATFEEAQHQAYVDPSQLNNHFINAEEGGPIGWVPPEERGFQHQSASTNAIGSNNEVSIGYSTIDQQPQFAPTTAFHPQTISNWSEQVVHQQQQPPRQPSNDLAIYQMAGEAVSFHQQVQVQDPSDVIAGQPQSARITNVPQTSISIPAPQAVYPSTLLDPSSTSPSVPFRQQHQQHQPQQQHALGSSHPQPAVAQGYHDIQVQQQPHSHEVNLNHSHTAHSTSSGSSSTGTVVPPAVSNSGLAASSASSASATASTDPFYPVGIYQQTPCGSSESMAILNGELPHHQQPQVPHQQHQLYSASGSYEAQSQYLAHHPQTSTRAQTFHSGLSDSTTPSNFITSSSSTSTTTNGAVVQQPQPLAPSRTSSLAAWADVPPAPIVNPESAQVVQEYHQQPHYQQIQYQQQQQPEVVKEEEVAGVYSPIQDMQSHPMKVEMDVKPQHRQSYCAQEQAVKPISPQMPIQPHHPGMSRSSTDVAVPRAQPQPLGRSATLPDMSSASAQRPSASPITNALAPTRSVAEFDVAPRPVEAIKASETVRQAAKLHIDLGQADPNSPTSHEARLKARSLRRKGSAAPPQHGYSPYHREFAARRGSSASQHDQTEHQHAHPQQPIVPSSRPTNPLQTDQYGAQRTFIFNPYQDPNSVPADGKQGQIPHGVPLPTPCAGASGVVTAVVSGAPVPAQHQTIEFSGSAESMSPDDLSKGKAIDRNAADAAALMMGEKKPFLACGFCRQRKIACGQRAPHPRDGEIGEGPRTCNQCARRHILCSFPSESRRGLRKTKPVTKTIIQEDGTEITVVVEDEEEIEELEQVAPSKKQSKSKKKGRGPMEWIIAADAWLITPAAWAAHKAAQEKKASEGNGNISGSSGMPIYHSSPFEDAPSVSPTHV